MDYFEFIVKSLTTNLLRYFLVAGAAFLLFYVIKRRQWSFKKIQSQFPSSKDYRREIIFSLITVTIFLLVALSIFATPLKAYSMRYYDFSEYGWGYWIFSVIVMLFIHDTYFYWMHRLMHLPFFFKRVHLIHHKSTNPSPWAAYAFHPLEAIVEAGIIYCIVFTLPFHKTALFTFLLIMIFLNVYGHLGYELYPKGFNKHWLGRWINTSVNHNQHHKQFHGNYGLYFLFWDRLMGTIRPDYDDAYSKVDDKRSREPISQHLAEDPQLSPLRSQSRSN